MLNGNWTKITVQSLAHHCTNGARTTVPTSRNGTQKILQYPTENERRSRMLTVKSATTTVRANQRFRYYYYRGLVGYHLDLPGATCRNARDAQYRHLGIFSGPGGQVNLWEVLFNLLVGVGADGSETSPACTWTERFFLPFLWFSISGNRLRSAFGTHKVSNIYYRFEALFFLTFSWSWYPPASTRSNGSSTISVIKIHDL